MNLKNMMLNKRTRYKDYILYDFIYMKFRNKQNYKSVVIEIRMVFFFWERID